VKRVRIVVRNDKPQADEIARDLISMLTERSVEAAYGLADPEAIVAIGGDGTVLAAASAALDLGVPLCGVNVGRVGYLAEYEAS